MKNIDSTFDETYSNLISFYKNISKREEIRSDEISELTQIAHFYFNLQQKFKKIIDFELSIIYKKNVGLFVLNDSIILSGEYLDFKDESLLNVHDLNISAYVLVNSDNLKSSFSIENNEDFIFEENSLSDYEVSVYDDDFVLNKNKEETKVSLIVKNNVFDFESEISSYLKSHFDLILFDNKTIVNKVFEYLRDASLFFDSAKNASSVYLKDEFKYKTNIDFSFIVSNYLPEKKYTLEQYKDSFRNINDFLILTYDIDISEEIKHTLLFKNNENKKNQPYI